MKSRNYNSNASDLLTAPPIRSRQIIANSVAALRDLSPNELEEMRCSAASLCRGHLRRHLFHGPTGSLRLYFFAVFAGAGKRSLPLAASTTRIESSWLPMATVFPSGEKATDQTELTNPPTIVAI